MKKTYWVGLHEDAAFHAVSVGGHNIQRVSHGGLGNLIEMTDEEAAELRKAVAGKACGLDGNGRATMYDVAAGALLPDGAVFLTDLVWVQEYQPDRASTVRQEDQFTLAEKADIAAAEAKAKSEADAAAKTATETPKG